MWQEEVIAWLKARYETQLETEGSERKLNSRILAQRAILAGDAYWGTGYGDLSHGDPRASRRMEL